MLTPIQARLLRNLEQIFLSGTDVVIDDPDFVEFRKENFDIGGGFSLDDESQEISTESDETLQEEDDSRDFDDTYIAEFRKEDFYIGGGVISDDESQVAQRTTTPTWRTMTATWRTTAKTWSMTAMKDHNYGDKDTPARWRR